MEDFANKDSSYKTDTKRIVTMCDNAFIEELKHKLKKKLLLFVEEFLSVNASQSIHSLLWFFTPLRVFSQLSKLKIKWVESVRGS